MVKITKAEEKHIPAIKGLWVEFLKYSEGFHPVFAIRQSAADHMESTYLRPAMHDKSHRIVLALEGKKAVAYAVAKINDQLLFLFALFALCNPSQLWPRKE